MPMSSGGQFVVEGFVMHKRRAVVLQQVAIADYRQKFLDLLAQSLGGRLCVLAGKEYFEPSTRTAVVLPGCLSIVKNYFMLGRRFVFQPAVVAPCVRAHVAVLELNPRSLTTWLVLLVRRILRRKTILWGHAWPRAGADSPSDNVRNLMRTLGNVIVVYTESQRRELESRMPGKAIVAAPNSIYLAEEMRPVATQGERRHFLYVGRLVSQKKVDLLVRAFAKFKSRSPECNNRLIVVGDGPEKSQLMALCRQLRVSGDVDFMGHVASIDALRSIYETALVSVSPGGVGLSLTQSLGFGVPMIVADREPHGPEFEAVLHGTNALLFSANDADALCDGMLRVVNDSVDWISRAASISAHCRRSYSANAMADRMVAAIFLAEGR